MSVFGKDFAFVYNDHWSAWTRDRAWPFLRNLVRERFSHARSWLDLCCGSGWLLKFAGREGFETFGVDRSRHQLQWARKNAPKARLICADVRNYSLDRQVDVITCTFDSLNYLMRKNDLLRALRTARRHLDAAGVFVFDMNTYEGLQDAWRHTSAMHEKDWTTIMVSSFNAKTAIGCVEITGFVREGRLYRKFVERHEERGYRTAEIDDLLTRAGFRFRKRDGVTLGRPRKRSPRLLYICQHAARPGASTRKRESTGERP